MPLTSTLSEFFLSRFVFFRAPGDMLLYESAACTHGRERPLNGRSFANIFVHFRPPNWLKQIGVE